jgi:hypothetical protein
MAKTMTQTSICGLAFVCLLGLCLAGQEKAQDRRKSLDPKTETTDDPRRIPVPSGPRGPEGVLVLRGGRIFDGTGAPVHEGTVVIRRNKIDKILPAGVSDWPKDARVIDVGGKTVMPGLIDAHTHVDYSMPETPALMDISEADSMLRAVERARFYLECGITSIRDVGPFTTSRSGSRNGFRKTAFRLPASFPLAPLSPLPAGTVQRGSTRTSWCPRAPGWLRGPTSGGRPSGSSSTGARILSKWAAISAAKR